MFYFRGETARCANDSDDIEAIVRADALVLKVVVDGKEKVVLFLKVDGCYGVEDVTTAAGFHLNEHNYVVFLRNDINIQIGRAHV